MNNKVVIVVSIILVFSLIVNGYLYATLVQTENDALAQISALEIERDALTAEVDTLTTERDWLQFQVSTISSERDDLQNERDNLNDEVVALTTERNRLNAQVSSLTNERDEALAEVETYANLNSELDTEVNKLKAEQDDLLTQVSFLIAQRDDAWANVTILENQKEKLEKVITFNTSNLQTLVFHISEKNWTDIPDINYTYNEILALNNNTYEIMILPEFEEHQNWTAELEWLNNNFMGKQGIPIMLEAFGGSEGGAPITKLFPENITTALTTCNIKYLRFTEVISWHMQYNVTFPTTYVKSMLDFCRTNNLKIFWTEWKTDYLPIADVFTSIQTLIEGYEDIVTVSFSTNSGEAEPAFGFLNLDEMFQHWGASIQAWYWDTRYEDLLNMPISLLIQHTLAAKNIGAEIIQFEPYWYFFNSENGEITEKLEVLFTMLK